MQSEVGLWHPGQRARGSGEDCIGGWVFAEEPRKSQSRAPASRPRPPGAEDRQPADLDTGKPAPVGLDAGRLAPVGAGARAFDNSDSEELEDPRTGAWLAELRSRLQLCTRHGKWQQVLTMFEEAREAMQEPDLEVYYRVLRAHEFSRNWEAALALLAELLQHRYVEVNSNHFNSVMITCKGTGRWERVLALLQHMRTLGPAPDTNVYNAAIGACTIGLTDETRWQYSLLLLEQMMRPEVGASERTGAVPGTRTFGAVIAACEKGFQWERSLAVFHQMREARIQPSEANVHSALRACETCGKWEEALSICSEAWPLLGEGSLILPFHALFGAFISAGEAWRVPREVFAELRQQALEVLDAVLRSGWTCQDISAEKASRHMLRFLMERSGRMQLQEPGTDAFEMYRFSELAGPSIQVMGRLLRYDQLGGSHVGTWLRRVQRPLERRLRELYDAGKRRRRGEAFPTPSAELGGVNDLATWAGGSLRALGLLGRRAGQEVLPARAVQRRGTWWLIDSWGENPETALITVMATYRIAVGSALLRSPGKLGMQRSLHCEKALTPIHMFRDRVQHRATHAERQALMQLSARIFLRAQSLPERELAARGELWLHVNHTPCLSCTGVISQFQSLFPTVSVTVSFDVWWDLRPMLQSPWKAPRFPPVGRREKEGAGEGGGSRAQDVLL